MLILSIIFLHRLNGKVFLFVMVDIKNYSRYIESYDIIASHLVNPVVLAKLITSKL